SCPARIFSSGLSMLTAGPSKVYWHRIPDSLEIRISEMYLEISSSAPAPKVQKCQSPETSLNSIAMKTFPSNWRQTGLYLLQRRKFSSLTSTFDL
ncbi:MAG: hypothetical protein ACK56I_29485, partial [bacterium]